MKLKFKKQSFQTNAVNAVADCFAGQPKTEGVTYRIDPGKLGQTFNARGQDARRIYAMRLTIRSPSQMA